LKDRDTALADASRHGHLASAKMLDDHGADVDVKDDVSSKRNTKEEYVNK